MTSIYIIIAVIILVFFVLFMSKLKSYKKMDDEFNAKNDERVDPTP